MYINVYNFKYIIICSNLKQITKHLENNIHYKKDK